MSESKAAEVTTLVPQVSIQYKPTSPFPSLLEETGDFSEALESAVKKGIGGQTALTSIGERIKNAIACRTRLEENIDVLRDATAAAWARYLPEATITVSVRMKDRQRLDTAIEAAKRARANFLDAEARRVQEEQRKKDLEQQERNRKEAEKAAALAKKSGADKETIRDIKEDILSTPAAPVAPRVEATSTLRYLYGAELESMKELFTAAIVTPHILATLMGSKAVREAIESAFRPMAISQKEAFSAPGMKLRRTPCDVQGRAR